MNIVFLDIDGVILPYHSEDRYEHLYDGSIEMLSKKYNIDYKKYSKYDVLAAYYDWNKKALILLKEILDETNSKIIISSDWRQTKFKDKMPDLLKMHNLDNYWYKDNIYNNSHDNNGRLIHFPLSRKLEIDDSIKRYNIDNFVILDDEDGLLKYYPYNMVLTNNVLNEKNKEDAIKILKREKLN